MNIPKTANLIELDEYLQRTGKNAPIVLLEGKRNVPEQDAGKLELLGKTLTRRYNNVLFRSGNAIGADALFSAGVASVNPSRLQQVIPYKTHRKAGAIDGVYTIPLDDVDLVQEPDIIYYTTEASGKAASLIPLWLQGKTNRLTAKVPYLLRDTVKVLGSASASLEPADFAIFYDDLSKPRSGGTGHTMKICEKNSVPFVDQTIWMQWVDKFSAIQ